MAIVVSASFGMLAGPTYAGDATPNSDERIVERSVTVGADSRHFILYLPSDLKPNAPMMIAFHPAGASAERMRKLTGMALERMAKRHNFAIAYPDGFEGHFNDCRRASTYSAHKQNIDDVRFSRALVKDVAAHDGIDASHVYALGYSNGAQMALRLAMEAPELVVGVVAIGANVPASDNNDCQVKNGRHVSVALIEGTKDPVNPYDGGEVAGPSIGNLGTVLSATASAQWFAARYGVAEQKDVPAPLSLNGLTAKWRDWGDSGTKVRLITIEGGGHTIPQEDVDFSLIYPKFPLGNTFKSDAPIESAWDAVSGASQ